MAIVWSEPEAGGLSETVDVLREWQYEGAPMHLATRSHAPPAR
ncbi:hypothetical protein [Streptomyces sp.]|nr:hypothetical protein [Streptomyces sp.]HZF88451.1 hypothetical protein [Streptomyces sp.]